MREIKFRAWDTKLRKMLFTGFHVIGEVTAFDLIGSHCLETKGDAPSMERWNDMELMQYSGLVDKNGVEIYEGDMVKIDFHPPEYRQVIFELGSFKYKALGKNEHNIELGIHANRTQKDPLKLDGFEIIGNIYEHKYLLDTKTEK